jgi:type III secretion protein R
MTSLAEESMAGTPLGMMAVLSLLALAPFAVLTLTSFSKMAVVLSIARSALGSQQAPPTLVLTALAGVLSAHVMAPVMERMVTRAQRFAAVPTNGAEWVSAGLEVTAPLKDFLVQHASPEERARFADLSRELRAPDEAARIGPDDLAAIVPAFVVTELKEAFQIGFLIFLPFLVLDMLVANVLLALGMQSLAPSQVSLPFKLLLFVAVDGWGLLSEGLVLGYRVHP